MPQECLQFCSCERTEYYTDLFLSLLRSRHSKGLETKHHSFPEAILGFHCLQDAADEQSDEENDSEQPPRRTPEMVKPAFSEM